jgi:hypothetical protein
MDAPHFRAVRCVGTSPAAGIRPLRGTTQPGVFLVLGQTAAARCTPARRSSPHPGAARCWPPGARLAPRRWHVLLRWSSACRGAAVPPGCSPRCDLAAAEPPPARPRAISVQIQAGRPGPTPGPAASSWATHGPRWCGLILVCDLQRQAGPGRAQRGVRGQPTAQQQARPRRARGLKGATCFPAAMAIFWPGLGAILGRAG